MESLRDYTIKMQNNTVINESFLFENYNKELNSILYKSNLYINNSYNNYINESQYNYTLSIDESNAIKQTFIYLLESYNKSLIDESKIYEGLLNGSLNIDELPIYEGFFVDNIKNLWKTSKDNFKETYNKLKTKIKEVNEFIQSLLNRTFKTIKDILLKFLELLDKLNISAQGLFKRLGIKEKIADEMFDDAIKYLINDDRKEVEKVNIYEDALGGFGLFFNPFKNTKNSEFAQNHPVWAIIISICSCAFYCILIPAIAYAAAPVGIIAPAIYVTVKLLWQVKGLVQIYRQYKDFKRNSGSWTKKEKRLKLICLFVTIGLWVFNVQTFWSSGAGKAIFDLITKQQFLDIDNTIIQPDGLVKGLANGLRNLAGKPSLDDVYDKLTDVVEKASTTIKPIGKNIEDISKEYVKGTYGSSTEACKNIITQNKIDLNSIPDEGKVSLMVNGSPDSKYGKYLFDLLQKYGISKDSVGLKYLTNKGLTLASAGKGGAMYTFEAPCKIVKKLLSGDLTAIAKDGFIGAIGGSIPTEVASETAKNLIDAGMTTLPYADYAVKPGKGFRVRLGNSKKDSNNYIYEIYSYDNNDGIKSGKLNDLKLSDSNKKQYNKLVEPILNNIDEEIKTIEKDEKNNDKIKIIKERRQQIENGNTDEIIVFYGKRVDDDTKESKLISLTDYIIEDKADLKNDAPNEISKLFNGKELTDEDKKKIKDFINKKLKLNKLPDEKFIKVINSISELVGKVQNNETNDVKESLENIYLYESKNSEIAEKNNLTKNIYNLREYLWKLANEKAKDNEEVKKAWNKIYKPFQTLFSFISKEKYDIDGTSKTGINGISINNIAYFFNTYIFSDLKQKDFYNLQKAFLALVNIKEKIINKTSEELKNDENIEYIKNAYNTIFEIFNKSKLFDPPFDYGKFDDISEEGKQKLNNDIKDNKKEEAPEEIQKRMENNENNENTDSDISDNDISLYKAIITTMGNSSDKVKKDIEDETLKLIDDEEIKKQIKQELGIDLSESLSESLNIFEGKILDKLKQALQNLKTYILGEKQPDDGKKSEDNSNNGNDEQKQGDDNSGNNEQKQGNDNEQNDSSKENKYGPVLMFAYGLGIDLADANENGPRETAYAIAGCSNKKDGALQFILIPKGENLDGIEKILGDYLYKQLIALYKYVPLKPCVPKDKDEESDLENLNIGDIKKWVALSVPSDRREDYGHLTNEEITEIFKKKERGAVKFINITDSIFSNNEKKLLKKSEDKFYNDVKNKIDKGDEKTINKIKEIDKDAFDKDNKPNYEIIDPIIRNNLFKNQLSLTAEKKKKKTGIWSKIKKWIGNMFDSYNYIEVDNNIFEDLDNYIYKSLSQYIKEN